MTPSVGGMRFLPLAAIAALILTAEALDAEHNRASAALPRSLALSGHALWLFGMAWSAETGFFVTLLWWPWMALRQADAEPSATARARWLALIKGGLRGLAAVVAGYGALALLFRAVFGDWLSLEGFLLYFINPPGPMPVFLMGAIWFAAAVLLLGYVGLARAGRGNTRRTVYVSLLAALAAGSYYLSRSHDNNVLNLLPYFILLLLAARQSLPGEFCGGFVRAALAGIVALTVSIHFHAWTVLPGSPSLAGLQIGPGALVSRFTPVPGRANQLEWDDAAVAYADLRRQSAEGILVFDGIRVMPDVDFTRSWSVVNDSANFHFLRPEIIRHYVQQGAKLYRSPGWLLLANKDTLDWLAIFGAAYDVSETRHYGSYTAYHMVPRAIP